MLTACANDTEDSVKIPEMGVAITDGADGSGKLDELTAVSDAMAKEALSAATGSDALAEATALADGVLLYTYTLKDGGKAYIVKADLNKVKLAASTPYQSAPVGVGQSLASQAKILGMNAIAGINANAYDAATKEPVGIIVTEGKQIYDKGFNDGSICFGVTDSGKAFACSYDSYGKLHRNKTTEVVSATKLTINNTALVKATSDMKASRSAAGFTADRETVFLAYAENTDCETMASLLLGHGCSVAVEFGYEAMPAAMYLGADKLYGSGDNIGATLFIAENN